MAVTEKIMNKVIEVTITDVDLLNRFVKNLGEGKHKFRYLDKRGVEVVKNHIVTLLLMEDENPVAYGHLDKVDDFVWLGTAVAENRKRKGYGKVLVEHLLAEAKKRNIEKIYLSVDKDNLPAIALYQKCGFIKQGDKSSFFIYALNVAQ